MVGSVPHSTDKETEALELGSLFKVTWEVGDRAASNLPAPLRLSYLAIECESNKK